MTGLSIWSPLTREFEFRPGPIFANIVLVDEINRALPKAQSALLEGMSELQVTVDGATRPLPDPFLLIATENPIEQDGTYALPEAQLDRFLLRTSLGYPSVDEEIRILDDQIHGHPLGRLRPVAGLEDLRVLREAVEHVYIDPLVKRWAVDLVRATRELPFLELGASVRASLALDRASRAWALADGRDYVVPEDVERLFEPVVSHRILLGEELLVDESVSRGRDRPSRLGGVSRARAPARARLGRRDAPAAMSDGARAAVRARPTTPIQRRAPRGAAHPAAGRRRRGRGLAPVPAGRPHQLGGLGRVGAALGCSRERRARRARVLRRAGPTCGDRVRPSTLARDLRCPAAVAGQAGGDRGDRRARESERASGAG